MNKRKIKQKRRLRVRQKRAEEARMARALSAEGYQKRKADRQLGVAKRESRIKKASQEARERRENDKKTN